MFGCETWSLTLKKVQRLRDEVIGWRKLHITRGFILALFTTYN
jgi:hypothetical protein